MISKLIKFPIFKRVIPSLSIRFLKLLNKNRGYFRVNGFKMFLDFLDPIDREIILSQEFEKQEIDFLINQIKYNNVKYFIDVGANCGYYSLKISKEIPNIKILAFEPNIEAFFKFSKSLEKNINLSKKITLKNFGLSNISAKLKMRSMIKFGYTQTGGSVIVNDNENNKNFNFVGNFKIADSFIKFINEKISIKIDVEGHELNVLEGMRDIIKKNKCVLQIEVFEKNYNKLENFLKSLGYKKTYEIKNNLNYFYSNFD